MDKPFERVVDRIVAESIFATKKSEVIRIITTHWLMEIDGDPIAAFESIAKRVKKDRASFAEYSSLGLKLARPPKGQGKGRAGRSATRPGVDV